MVSQNYKIKITQTAQPGSKAVNYLDLTCLARAFFPSTIPAYMKISLVKLGFLSHSPAAPKQHALSIPISLLLWSLTRWTWIWVNSGSWWWTGRPGVLRFMGSQRVRHDWATELNWTELSTTEGYLNTRHNSCLKEITKPFWTKSKSYKGIYTKSFL